MGGQLQWKCEGKKETQGGQGGVLLSPSKLLRETYIPPSTSLSSPDSTGSGRPRRRPSFLRVNPPSYLSVLQTLQDQGDQGGDLQSSPQIRPSFLRVNPPSHLSVLQTPQDQGDQGGDLQSSPQIRPSFLRVNPPSHLSVLQTLQDQG